MPPSVVVVGPGAIGTYFAALLSARALADITLVAKNAEQAARLEASALTVVRAAPEPSEAPLVAHVRVRALAQLGALPPGAIVILTTKATALPAGLSALAPVLGPGHALVLTQNGVGVLDETRAALPARPGPALVRAACWMGITSDAPGQARVAGVHSLVLADAGAAGLATTPEVVEGGPSSPSSPAEAVLRLMEAAGIPTRLEADPRAVEWKKALWNMAVNPIGALLEAANGAVLDDQGLRRTAERILDEAMAVAEAEGVALGASDRDLVFRSLEVTRKNYNSSLQDLWAGRPTETPWLVGAVGRLGRARGVPTPLCDALTALLLHLERTGIRKR